jgi:hypothetical protein
LENPISKVKGLTEKFQWGKGIKEATIKVAILIQDFAR